MRYSTGLKKRSRLQGHRRRRRVFEVKIKRASTKLCWTEYKTLRQYKSMGDMLDEFKTYGYSEGVEMIRSQDKEMETGNGYKWLTLEFEHDDGP
jgi:hypothetical protein